MSSETTGSIELSHPFSHNQSIACLTIRNERAANCMTTTMLHQLAEHTKELYESRAVIVTSEGPHFCAGADIREWGAMTPREFAQDWVRDSIRAFEELERLPGTVIAAINGTCLGGGIELALHCDIRISAKTAKFAMPETGLGITPGWKGGPMLARVAGPDTAARLVLAGETLDAMEAREAGIVGEVCEDVSHRARELAEAISERSPVANAEAKKLIASWLDNEHSITEKHVLAAFEGRSSKDCDEGLQAFAEKRKPKF